MSEELTEIGASRGYIQLSKAWYGGTLLLHDGVDGVLDRISIGIYLSGGGTHGEFQVEWKLLREEFVPRLMAYSDAWSVLPEFSDLLAEIAKVDKPISPEEFASLLDSLGIKNMTVTDFSERGA